MDEKTRLLTDIYLSVHSNHIPFCPFCGKRIRLGEDRFAAHEEYCPLERVVAEHLDKTWEGYRRKEEL